MELTPLCEIADKFGTDKFYKHHYTPVYFDLLKDRILTTRLVLEIGVKTGVSLRMWEKFFPNAEIIGIDRKRRWLFDEGRIRTFLANQDDDDSMISAAAMAVGLYDLIVDDGSHKPEHQVASAKALMSFLRDGGIYVIEDVLDERIYDTLSKDFSCQMLRTNTKHVDSVLVIIRK